MVLNRRTDGHNRRRFQYQLILGRHIGDFDGMLGGILARLGLGPIHRWSGRQPKQTHRELVSTGAPGKQGQAMDFDAVGFHQNNALVDIHEQIRLRSRGQLDLVLENGVRFQECPPLGLGIATRGGCLGRKTVFETGDREKGRDKEPSVAQLRK